MGLALHRLAGPSPTDVHCKLWRLWARRQLGECQALDVLPGNPMALFHMSLSCALQALLARKSKTCRAAGNRRAMCERRLLTIGRDPSQCSLCVAAWVFPVLAPFNPVGELFERPDPSKEELYCRLSSCQVVVDRTHHRCHGVP